MFLKKILKFFFVTLILHPPLSIPLLRSVLPDCKDTNLFIPYKLFYKICKSFLTVSPNRAFLISMP